MLVRRLVAKLQETGYGNVTIISDDNRIRSCSDKISIPVSKAKANSPEVERLVRALVCEEVRKQVKNEIRIIHINL